jgi:hypothetical protein
MTNRDIITAVHSHAADYLNESVLAWARYDADRTGDNLLAARGASARALTVTSAAEDFINALDTSRVVRLSRRVR